MGWSGARSAARENGDWISIFLAMIDCDENAEKIGCVYMLSFGEYRLFASLLLVLLFFMLLCSHGAEVSANGGFAAGNFLQLTALSN